MPVIFDDYVDKDFGTGVLKITPAHDINDFNIGLKYNLPVVDTLNEDGTLSEAAQIFIGEDRFAATQKNRGRIGKRIVGKRRRIYYKTWVISQRTNVVAEPRFPHNGL